MAQQDVIAVDPGCSRPKAAFQSHASVSIPAALSPFVRTGTGGIVLAAATSFGHKKSFESVFSSVAVGA